ncbi:MAG TPA: hypothetical protein VLZ81_09370, partial [Blastocatellia bacterium]|nr:hypothetical protein [Blastocatellia bacterium]
QGGGYGTPPFGGGGSPQSGPPQGGQPQTESPEDGSDPGQTGQDSGQQGQRRRGNLAVLLNEPESLDISQKDPTLTINQTLAQDNKPQTRTIYTDGRSMNDKDAQGDAQQSRAKWNGHKLVIETKNDLGTITETYELESSGRELKVTTKVEGGRMHSAVTVKRVYEVVKPDSTKPDVPKS